MAPLVLYQLFQLKAQKSGSVPCVCVCVYLFEIRREDETKTTLDVEPCRVIDHFMSRFVPRVVAII